MQISRPRAHADTNPDGDEKPHQVESLQAIRVQALTLIEQLKAVAAAGPSAQKPVWLEYIGVLQDLQLYVDNCRTSGTTTDSAGPALTARQRQAFGALLRDKRDAAGLSRMQLGRRAKVSDSTIKFLETARHPPSRATLLRLLGVAELRFTWEDMPGRLAPPAAEHVVTTEPPEKNARLNFFVTPTCEPVREVVALGRLLNGAGGRVEHANAYLDPQSAADYLAMCEQSATVANLRASIPLGKAAQHILAAGAPSGLDVIALGPGDGTLEVRLVQHLAAQILTPSLDLCLLDISQALLGCAYRRATDTLGAQSQVSIWAMQCHFDDLSMYSQGDRPKRQRLFCLLGGTLSDLDNEPRFFQYGLASCSRGDLLLLDVPTASHAGADPEEIKRRDKDWSCGVTPVLAAWLGGPIWRHCKDVVSVQFHWQLEGRCAVPGSYALDAVATVQARNRDDRRFSMYRFRRYVPSQLAACLRSLGWDEIAALPYESGESASLCLFRKRTDGK